LRSFAVDAAVVGAGPGGCATAWRLAKAGLRVVLVDREIFPRPKTCGDGLSPRARSIIAAMGAIGDLGDRPTIRSLAVVDLAGGTTSRGPVPGGGGVGSVVPRVVLDDVLRRSAERAGALFVGQTEVRDLLRDGTRVAGIRAVGPIGVVELAARVTVVAEGAAGRLARGVRGPMRRPLAGAAVRQYVRVSGALDPAFRLYVPLLHDGDPLCGYGWVFPVSADTANVGVGRFLPERGLEPARLHGLLAGFLATLARHEPAFAAAEPCGRLEGGLVPAGLRPDEAAVDGALLVGDAAAVANPFTGEGIAHALESGCAAAEAILEHLDAGTPLRQAYGRRLRSLFPSGATWTDLLPWMAARGGLRAREFWELVCGRVGVVGAAARRVVLEERAAGCQDTTGVAQAAWEAAGAVVAKSHPILAELLRATRTVLGDAADGRLVQQLSRVDSPDPAARAALALLSMIFLLAGDVVDVPRTQAGEATSRRGAWASHALGIGMTDLLVAEMFGVLADAPAPVAARIAGLARDELREACVAALAGSHP
jgi:geranylgeranyl reductase family protein